MKIENYSYIIESGDLPLLDIIFNLEDRRSDFFIPDYTREEEYRKDSYRSAHVEYTRKEYYFENISKILNDKYGITNIYFCNVCCPFIRFVSKKIFSLTEVEDIKNIFINESKKFLEITYINFDLRELDVYKLAVSLNRVDLFESWLYGHYLCQLKHICVDEENEYKIDKVSTGIYRYPFIAHSVREKNIKKRLISWLEEIDESSLSEIIKKGETGE